MKVLLIALAVFFAFMILLCFACVYVSSKSKVMDCKHLASYLESFKDPADAIEHMLHDKCESCPFKDNCDVL